METTIRRVVGEVDKSGIISTLGQGLTSNAMAAAELIDNAIASREQALKEGVHVEPLQVVIRFQEESDGATSLIIRDTSVGMPAEIVQNKLFKHGARNAGSKTLHEYGVGAKEALGYLAGSLGHITLKTTHTDVRSGQRTVTTMEMTTLERIFSAGVDIRTRTAEPGEATGTQWTIHSVKGGVSLPSQRILFNTLGSIYRNLIESGSIQISGADSAGNSHLASYSAPELLFAYPMLSGEPDFSQPEQVWKVEVDFEVEIPKGLLEAALPEKVRVTGWLGCLQEFEQDRNGIAIIRRGRVVQMGGRAQWTPAPIFKNNGSPSDKRLVGEIFCDEIPTGKLKFEVDTRIAEPLAKALQKDVASKFPKVLRQAANYRKKDYLAAVQALRAKSGSETRSSDSSLAPTSSSPTGDFDSGTRSTPDSEEVVEFVEFGEFTNPKNSSSFLVYLIPATAKSGPPTWSWRAGENGKVLELVLPRVVVSHIKSDLYDERAVLLAKLLVALAILERESDEQALLTAELRKLVANLVRAL